LNLGQDLITDAQEREALAQLNLAAAQKAKSSTAYASARSFVQKGIELLAASYWQTQYELTLNLYIDAAENAYLNGDFDDLEEMSSLVLRSTKTILDKVKISEIQISALTTQGQILEAISVGRIALAQLGVELPSEPDEALAEKAVQNVPNDLRANRLRNWLTFL
jgi:predicted ATPase